MDMLALTDAALARICIGASRVSRGFSNPSSGFVLVQCPLKRAHEHIAFGAIVEDHAKTAFVNTLAIWAT
jgi:hypothetical protein